METINDYLKIKKREALKSLIGNYEIDLYLKSLEKSRGKAIKPSIVNIPTQPILKAKAKQPYK